MLKFKGGLLFYSSNERGLLGVHQKWQVAGKSIQEAYLPRAGFQKEKTWRYSLTIRSGSNWPKYAAQLIGSQRRSHLISFLPLAAPNELTNPWDQQIHGGNCLIVIIQPHVEGLQHACSLIKGSPSINDAQLRATLKETTYCNVQQHGKGRNSEREIGSFLMPQLHFIHSDDINSLDNRSESCMRIVMDTSLCYGIQCIRNFPSP